MSIPPPPSRATIQMTSDDSVDTSTEDSTEASAETSAEKSDEVTEEEESAEEEKEEDVAEETEGGEESEEPEEDPEVVELKENIAKLEVQLRAKRVSLSQVQDEAEQYSREGYARKIADIETERKMLDGLLKNAEVVGIANVVQQFIPIYESLESLTETYAGNKFGEMYAPLASSFKEVLMSEMGLGITEIEQAVGEPLNTLTTTSIRKEYSSEYEKGTVIEIVKPGLGLKGNVIKFAEAVESLGSEPKSEGEPEKGSEED